MQTDLVHETRRQVEICNACRYCEGYCSVFPAMTELKSFAEGDIVQLANLCHNCRGCYYACQYADPHEFSINIPKVFADVRHESWKEFAWPGFLAKLLDRSGVAVSIVLVLSFAALFWIAASLKPESGQGFYSHMSHGMMVAIFLPAFLFPLLAIGVSVRKYWRAVGGRKLGFREIRHACISAGRMKDLSGGHGHGCNFENEDEFTNRRRYFHQATLYGFLLCFASTSVATVMHYFFGMEAPYPFWSLPKLFGVPGGIILCIGTAGLAWLKTKADRELALSRIWNGEMAFVLLLFLVSATGLALYAATGTELVSFLLPLHLGTVLAFFLMTPYSKMIHGFYRMAALLQNSAVSNSISKED